VLVKIFVQDACPNCPASKRLGEKLKKQGVNVEMHDVRTAEGLAESLMFNVLSTPSTVIVDEEGREVASFLSTTPVLNQVKRWL
jgi:hypothetical protein